MPNNGHDDRSGREIRLLLLVIAVAVAVLLVLARFRFPEADIVGVTPSPNPLERMVTRGSFDDLGAAVTEAVERLTPVLTSIELGPASALPGGAAVPHTYVPALRVRPGVILAHMPAGMSPILPAGLQVVAVDGERELALLGMTQPGQDVGPAAPGIDLSAGMTGSAGSIFALTAEAGAGGLAIRPVFLPKLRPVASDRWTTPLLRAGGDSPTMRGAWVFTFDGRLIGLALSQADGLTLVDAAALDRLVMDLTGGKQ